jgi:hypothetical protein
MASMIIRDDAIWAKHLSGDPELVRRIIALPEEKPLVLVIEGHPVRFLKMRNGKDGRPTHGLKPDPAFRPFWAALQERRGQPIEVRLQDATTLADPYLASLAGLLAEWDSPEDAQAYDGL